MGLDVYRLVSHDMYYTFFQLHCVEVMPLHHGDNVPDTVTPFMLVQHFSA